MVASVRHSNARMQLTLRQARQKRRLTVTQLAIKSKVHKATVSRIERGEVQPMHETVVALEDALEYKRGTLVFGHREKAVA